MSFQLFHDANDLLRTMEQETPLASHANVHTHWEEDIRSLLSPESKEEQIALDAVLEIREKVHAAATSTSLNVKKEESSWEWLLTVPQVPQRTPEWYEEKRNILTASELSTIFKGGRTRGALIMAKAKAVPETPIAPPRLAVERSQTTSLDWGVRYEPVVKQYLEKTLSAKIFELGRIRHRNNQKLAASPDGLIGECKKDPSLSGRLLEIKCPSSRVIKEDAIPFEYWCQMQLQMEVCDREACEYVEVKFREEQQPKDPLTQVYEKGWITLESNIHTGENRYIYHDTLDVPLQEEAWAVVETYMWEIIQVRRVTVVRDREWFSGCSQSFETFWKDVEAARAGTFEMPAPRVKKVKESAPMKCAILDDESESLGVEVNIEKDIPESF